MNKNKRTRSIWILSVLIFTALLAPAASAASPQADLKINSFIETHSSIEFALEVPWHALRSEIIQIAGQDYTRLQHPGWPTASEAGSPALPFIKQTFGVPSQGAVSLTIVPGSAHRLRLAAEPLPNPTLTVQELNSAKGFSENLLPLSQLQTRKDDGIYSGQELYPKSSGRILTDGFIRQQRLVSIGLFPYQYDPQTQELLIYENLKVVISFEEQKAQPARELIQDSPYFEQLLRSNLVNYESARKWRVGQADLASMNDPAADPWLPPDPGWRIQLQETGIYQLAYAELSAADFPVEQVDPATVKLFNQGEEVAIRVTGNGDAVFDSDEVIIFYGQSLTSKYSQDNVYWLTYGDSNGIRMETRSAPPDLGNVPDSFTTMQAYEEGVGYITDIPGDDELERFLWAYTYPPYEPTWNYEFSLTDPIPMASASLQLALLGGIASSVNPDHHVQVYVNGSQVADVTFDGKVWYTLDAVIPAGVLLPGNNTISVTGPNDTGLGYDLVYIDRFTLAYTSGFIAENDLLFFDQELPGTWKFQINGFSTDQLFVYDVTVPATPVSILDSEVTGSESIYTLAFEETLLTSTSYWAGAPGSYMSVISIVQDNPSDLQAQTNGADYILITHSAFMDQAQTLADFRTSQRLRTILADVQDIYDEFNFGINHPKAIHDFLQHAYQHYQQPAPAYVLLLGDGNYDPKDYLNYYRASYIPPFLGMVDPWIGETASDNRYVTLAGADAMPDMMLGRISVENVNQAIAVVDKIISYEANLDNAAWRNSMLAVADDQDSGGDFPYFSDLIFDEYVPAAYEIDKVYYKVTHTDINLARAAIQGSINGGVFAINYIGHAAYTSWGEPQLFNNAHAEALSNTDMYPIILAMTCYDGFFHRPGTEWGDYRSLAEVVTRTPAKGAIASWSATGLGLVTGHHTLNAGFFDALFKYHQVYLGAAAMQGKFDLWTAGVNLDLLDTYTLFGDPALQLFPLYNLFLPLVVH